MASRDTSKKSSTLKQLWQVYQITRKDDPALTWIMIGLLVLGIVLGAVAGVFLGGQWFMFVLWIVVGLLAGALGALNVMNRRAERAAFRRIAGQPGAVGAVLGSMTGSWRSSQMPVAVNVRSADALYRAVGPKGVVLVIEGNAAKAQRMVNEERAKVRRAVPNVAIRVVHCAESGEQAVPLSRLLSTVKKTKTDKRKLSRTEVDAVQKRLRTLDHPVAMPKGVDPLRMRPDHRAVRGR